MRETRSAVGLAESGVSAAPPRRTPAEFRGEIQTALTELSARRTSQTARFEQGLGFKLVIVS